MRDLDGCLNRNVAKPIEIPEILEISEERNLHQGTVEPNSDDEAYCVDPPAPDASSE